MGHRKDCISYPVALRLGHVSFLAKGMFYFQTEALRAIMSSAIFFFLCHENSDVPDSDYFFNLDPTVKM